MSAFDPASAPALSSDLWRRIDAYEIGPPDASLDFPGRLAHDNGWSEEYAAKVVREYRRFCYLAVTAPHEVLPSVDVDRAWHLHLTYSRDYWHDFCPNVLKADLHHGPAAGGKVERARYYDQYAETFLSYEDAFGQAPPEDVWPDAKRRFANDAKHQRVKFDEVIILERRHAILGSIVWVLLGVLIAVLVGIFV